MIMPGLILIWADAIHSQIAANTHLSSQPSLFSRAIIHSGALAPRHIWSLERLDLIWSQILRQHVQGQSGTASERVAALRQSGSEELLHLAHTVAKVSQL